MNTVTATFVQKRTTWLLLSFGLAATIAALTLMPQASLPVSPQGVDNLYHMVAFAALIFPTAMLRQRAACTLDVLQSYAAGSLSSSSLSLAGLRTLRTSGLGDAIGIFLGLTVRQVLAQR